MLKKVFQKLSSEAVATGPPQPSRRSSPRVPVMAVPQPPQPSRPISVGEPRPRILRVLFVCIGNSCRSPMAEGLARHYGSDVMQVASAGLSPIHRVDPLGQKVMQSRNIDISTAFPKGVDSLNAQSFDLIINMSGTKLPSSAAIENWNVPDPIGGTEEDFLRTADLLEQMVMRLILQIRAKQHPALTHVRTNP